jgi:hypothetical protein
MLAPDHDTVTSASDVLERARQHHAWRRQVFAQPRRRAVLKVVEPEPKPEPAPAPVHEPEEWPEPGESFALGWVQVKDRAGINAKELFTLWQQMRASERLKAALESKPASGSAEEPEPVYRPPVLSIAIIKKEVARKYGITIKEMDGDSRIRSVVRPRQIAQYLCHMLLGRSLTYISERFGGRDHTTTLASIRRIKMIADADAGFREELTMMMETLSREYSTSSGKRADPRMASLQRGDGCLHVGQGAEAKPAIDREASGKPEGDRLLHDPGPGLPADRCSSTGVDLRER